jgi:hypothetical protein
MSISTSATPSVGPRRPQLHQHLLARHGGEFAQPSPQPLHLPLAHRAFLDDAVAPFCEEIKFAVPSEQFHLHTVARLLPGHGQEILFHAPAFQRSRQVLHPRHAGGHFGQRGFCRNAAMHPFVWLFQPLRHRNLGQPCQYASCAHCCSILSRKIRNVLQSAVLYQRPLRGTHRRALTVMAGLVPAIHGLRVDPAEVADASLRWHDGDHARKSRIQWRLELPARTS